jgi:protein-tyrosine phosphatase
LDINKGLLDMNQRILAWDGCINVRDLGGIPTRNGTWTQRGAIVRSDTPARLTPAGWNSLYDFGIRTIVTLSTLGHEEKELSFAAPFTDISVRQMAIEDLSDKEFLYKWAASDLWCTPLYYKDALARWPERHAAAISAIAQAQAGGVLFHCKRGNDRTGIITLLLLSLVGVSSEEIIAEYELSPDPERDEILARELTSTREALLGALEGLNAEEYLLSGGASCEDLGAVRRRMLG